MHSLLGAQTAPPPPHISPQFYLYSRIGLIVHPKKLNLRSAVVLYTLFLNRFVASLLTTTCWFPRLKILENFNQRHKWRSRKEAIQKLRYLLIKLKICKSFDISPYFYQWFYKISYKNSVSITVLYVIMYYMLKTYMEKRNYFLLRQKHIYGQQ